MMNAEEIIAYIRDAEKKTPVKVYVWEKEPVAFPNCREFPAGKGCKIVFGDWKDVAPVLKSNEFDHLEIENNCCNSAIPMMDLKDIPARIEPGAILREQVTVEKNAVIMMGAILNIGAVGHHDRYGRRARWPGHRGQALPCGSRGRTGGGH